MKPSEITASNSHAAMAEEISTLRLVLSRLISTGKKVAPMIYPTLRDEFIDAMIHAESVMKGDRR